MERNSEEAQVISKQCNKTDELIQPADFIKKHYPRLYEFERIRTIVVVGAFSRVFLVRHAPSNQYFAMKILNKTKDSCNLYLILEYVPGGELFAYLQKFKQFSEKDARFYASQIVLALEYLHSQGIIHRDLKLENILVGLDGYLKLADFGFAKRTKGRSWSVVGCIEYLAPELITFKGYTKCLDWWMFGIMVYELVAGYTPFFGYDEYTTVEKIIACKLSVPLHFSKELKNIVYHLLQADVSRRLGNLRNGVADIKLHQWFEQTDWMAIFNKKVEPPIIPKCSGPADTSNFPQYKEKAIETSSTVKYSKEFEDF
ncbi:cAMP-dependent protein kinase catalytic subunit 1-like [Dysidea avara]|uniref:cAMP-dependent protein kinase catalytic subunit 1-like n=1 Tax=Dysidea avara TaxID=196820 RepID=UPI00332AB788